MTSQLPTTPPGGKGAVSGAEGESLPVGLWIGTAVFALLAAGILIFSMRVGRQALVGSADREIEKHALEPRAGSLEEPQAPASAPAAAPAATRSPLGGRPR